MLRLSIAVSGPTGSGKTRLAKLITDQLEAQFGPLTIGQIECSPDNEGTPLELYEVKGIPYATK